MSIPAPAALPIEFHEVTSVRGETQVLAGISVRIAAGPPTVLIGPNGSGKTSLLRLAMGLATPRSGRLRWAGQPACPVTRLAFVFQRPVMLRRTVAENIGYALRAAGAPRPLAARRTAELLRMVGLASLAARPARSLSGGEQQRVALARALARDPEVLFLDEPTASLDPAATKTVEDLLRAVAAAGIKIVMSSHDLGEARRLAGDILLLHRGRLIEHDTADHFFNAPRTPEAAVFLAGELLL
jgi:tungstate transport system ATP-binding protein